MIYIMFYNFCFSLCIRSYDQTLHSSWDEKYIFQKIPHTKPIFGRNHRQSIYHNGKLKEEMKNVGYVISSDQHGGQNLYPNFVLIISDPLIMWWTVNGHVGFSKRLLIC